MPVFYQMIKIICRKFKTNQFYHYFLSKPNYFIKKYTKIKSDYLNRNPKGKWDFIRKIGNGVLRMIGVAIIDPEFSESWYSYVGGVVLFNMALSSLYTLWYAYHNETLLQGILFMAMFGINISVCVRTVHRQK